MAPGFCARLSATDPRCIVVTGDLDTHTRDLLDAELQALGTDGDVVLDLSGLTFIDSGGLHLLLTYHSLHDDAGTRLRVRKPSQSFTRLMDLVMLTDYFASDD